MDTYETTYNEFRWDTPEYFNFGNVIDEYAADPERVALLWEDQDGNRARLTFGDFREQSNRVANLLSERGIGAGDPILLVLPRIALWQAAYIGALKLGAIVVPCAAMLRENDLAYRANHSGAKAIIASVESAELVGELRTRCPALQHYLIAGAARSGWMSLPQEMQKASPKFRVAKTRALDPAICYYTSGTTREPKAVLHSNSYIYSQKFTGLNWFGLTPDDIHWTTADTGWAKAAYGVLFGPWMNGVTVFMYNGRFEPIKEIELLARHGITSFCATPTEYRMLVKQNLSKYKLPNLRDCTAAGEPLNPEVIEVWRKNFNLTIRDGYGQTETIILACNMPQMHVRPGSMGRPFPGHEVRVVDQNLAECKAQEVGQIAVRVKPDKPPSIMLEYLEKSRGKRTRVPRRLLSHRRSGLSRFGWLSMVRRTQ